MHKNGVMGKQKGEGRIGEGCFASPSGTRFCRQGCVNSNRYTIPIPQQTHDRGKSHYLIELNGLPSLMLHDRLFERMDVLIQRHPALLEQRSRNHTLRHVQLGFLPSHAIGIPTLWSGLLHKSIVFASFLVSMLHHDSHHSHS